MSFKIFLRGIRRRVGLGEDLSPADIARLNPDKIYVENVRSLLRTSSVFAEEICEAASRRGLLTRHIEVLGPEGNAVAHASNPADLPDRVTVWVEIDDDFEEQELETSDLDSMVYYSLNDREAEEAGII